jgi:hypothetical protein
VPGRDCLNIEGTCALFSSVRLRFLISHSPIL